MRRGLFAPASKREIAERIEPALQADIGQPTAGTRGRTPLDIKIMAMSDEA